MASVKEETLRSIKWTSIEKFSVQGIQFLLGLVMARLLSPSDYGIIGMNAIFLAISGSFIDCGFGTALIHKLDRTDVDFSTVFYFNIVVSIFFYFILYFIAPWVADFYDMPILCPILRVQSIGLFLNSLVQIHYTKLTIELNFKALAKRTFIASILSGIIGIICAYLGMGVWALIVQGLANTLIGLVFIWSYVKWHPLWTFSWKSFHNLFSYGSKLLVAGLIGTIYNNLTPLVIGKNFSSKDLGYYSRGTQFAKMPVDTINSVLGRVTFPILSKLQNDVPALIRAYRKYIRVMSMCIFFSGILLASLATPIIMTLLTEKWAMAIIYLQIYAFAKIFEHINTINSRLVLVVGRSDISLKMEVIKKTISTIILFSSIPFGVIGICVSKIIYTQIAVFLNMYVTKRLFKIGFISQWKDFIKYFMASILACIPAYLITLFNLPYIISILFGLIVSPLLYWFILRNNPSMKEVLNVVLVRFIKKNK